MPMMLGVPGAQGAAPEDEFSLSSLANPADRYQMAFEMLNELLPMPDQPEAMPEKLEGPRALWKEILTPTAFRPVMARRRAERQAPYYEAGEDYEQALRDRESMMRTIFPSLLRDLVPEDERDLPDKLEVLQNIEETDWFKALEPGEQQRIREGILGVRAPWKTIERLRSESEARRTTTEEEGERSRARRRTPEEEFESSRQRAAGRAAGTPAGGVRGKAQRDPRAEAERKAADKIWVETGKPDEFGELPSEEAHMQRFTRELENYRKAMDQVGWEDPVAEEPEITDQGPQYSLDTTKMPEEMRSMVEQYPGLQEFLTLFYRLQQEKALPEGIDLRLPRQAGPPGAMEAEIPPLGGAGEPAPQTEPPDFQRIMMALRGFRKMAAEPGANVEDMRAAFEEMYGMDPYELEIPGAP
jgi:hypothetical protein